MLAILKLGAGLLLLITSNIALGSVSAIIDKNWNWKVFWKGVIKGAFAVFSFIAVYFAGWLNPELVIIEVDGQTVNLVTAVYLVLLAGFAFYASAVLIKLKNIITLNTAAKEITPEVESGETSDDVAEKT